MYAILAVMLALVLALPANAADKFDAEACARTVAPFIDEQTVVIAHVDLARIDIDALLDWVVEAGRLEAKDIEAPRRELRGMLSAFSKAGGKEIYIVVSLADVPFDPPLVIVPLADGADAKAIRAILSRIPVLKQLQFEIFGQSLVGGSAAAQKRLRNGKPDVRTGLAKAFAVSGDTTAQVLLLPTRYTGRIVEELLPALPPQLGGGSTRPLSHGLRWAAVGVDLPPKPSLRLHVQSPDAALAGALKEMLNRIVKSAVVQRELRPFLPDAGRLAEVITPRLEENRLALSVKDKELNAILPKLVQRTVQDARHRDTINKLHQLSLAMHNYADVYKGRLPAVANFDKQGKPLLSWRVHLLPFLEQQNLYRQFHLDEPWDSSHNKKLLARMPKIYQGSNGKLNAEGKTIFLVPVGKSAAFKDGPERMRLPADFLDGTSNTILIVEADDTHAVPWTKPEDLKIDPEHPKRGLGGHFPEGFFAALADGAVRLVGKEMSKATLRDAFDPADGRPLGRDW